MMTDKESLSNSDSVGVDLDQKTDDTCQVEDNDGMNPDNHWVTYLIIDVVIP